MFPLPPDGTRPLLCVPEGCGPLAPESHLVKLILGPNTMEAKLDHVLLLLIILQQKKYVSSEIYTSQWSPIPPGWSPNSCVPQTLLLPWASI